MWDKSRELLKALFPDVETAEIEHALEAAVGKIEFAEKYLNEQRAAQERVRPYKTLQLPGKSRW